VFGIRIFLLLAAFALVLTGATAIGGQAAPRRVARTPQTLIALPYDVSAFAQTGGQLVWFGERGVERFDLRRKTRSRIRVSGAGGVVVGFVLSGSQVLLAELAVPCGLSDCDVPIRTAALHERAMKRVDLGWCDPNPTDFPDSLGAPPGCDRLPVAASARMLFYLRYCPYELCSAGSAQGPEKQIRRVTGKQVVGFANPASDVTALAAAGGRVVVSEISGRVSILDAGTHQTVREFVAKGVEALALSPPGIVALIANGRSRRIAIYSAEDGTLQHQFRVPGSTAPEVSVSGAAVLFRTGNTIRLLDAASGRMTVLATAASRPIGLSIVGQRVAWAESTYSTKTGYRARIRAITLGGS
jgi:hypothetical protein